MHGKVSHRLSVLRPFRRRRKKANVCGVGYVGYAVAYTIEYVRYDIEDIGYAVQYDIRYVGYGVWCVGYMT